MSLADSPFVTIGMGGNIGDVAAAMQWALAAINADAACALNAISPVYRTAPWGLVDQPDFLNCCASLHTTLSPIAFLDLIQRVEIAAGRVRDIRWGPRTLDIDILTFGNLLIKEDRLIVPHPRMLERAFVMVPLADIAPDVVISGYTTMTYAANFGRDGITETDMRLSI